MHGEGLVAVAVAVDEYLLGISRLNNRNSGRLSWALSSSSFLTFFFSFVLLFSFSFSLP